MIFKPLDIYEPVFLTKARYIDLWGGRGRGGSFFASQYFLFLITQPKFFRGFVSRAVYSDIKSSIWQELLDRIDENDSINIDDFKIVGTSQMTYKPTGWTITAKGFRSGNSGRTANLKGFAGATHIIIDEAEEITKPQSNQLNDTFRTIKAQIQIIRVFNPPQKNHFLIKDNYLLTPAPDAPDGFFTAQPKGNKNHLSVFSTYKQNEKHINKQTKENFENYKHTDPDYYYHQIQGLVAGGAKGVIFKYKEHWFKYSELPEVDFYETFGLDFGGGGALTDKVDGTSKTVFSRILINKATMSVYIKVIVYKGQISSKELTDVCIQKTIIDGKKFNILADNARQDKIREMLNDGLSILGAKTKEGGSSKITSGYDILKLYKLYIHINDIHAQTELNHHKWATNKAGETTGQPEDRFKDFLDSVRYALVNYHLYNF